MQSSRMLATPLSVDVVDAACRIEDWLLGSPAQLLHGAQRGAVAGRLDRDGRPEFVYLEITGYYLTAMGWLAAGGASSPERACTARVRGGLALEWLSGAVHAKEPPPTRLSLTDGPADWRNGGLFSFDLAMAARGAATAPSVARGRDRRAVLARLGGLIEGISRDDPMLRSHDAVDLPGVELPDRWSTRPGPHHLKAAAGLLRARVRPRGLRQVCARTCDHWAAAMRATDWPCVELHTLFYGLEGMLIRAGVRGDLAPVAQVFMRLMGYQSSDGTLPETVTGGIVRSDVLAQALRIGMVLRRSGHLPGLYWSERLTSLATALLGFVAPDGGVRFALDQDIDNTWCAMFAHQALTLFVGGIDDPGVAIELLV